MEDCCPFAHRKRLFFTVSLSAIGCLYYLIFLQRVFTVFNKVFSKRVFICGFNYSRQKKEKSQLLNFVLGQTKMAVYIGRKRKVEGGNSLSCPSDRRTGLIQSKD